ncbi:transaldolase [Methylacidiphilum caldifontis]|uniref:Transaldolase n=1 Tax=Methylacidiphilum caldifontis TaxID=2795386 RepID=A0A4Y8PGZ2_9BACT|nr:transaldolase [Methylacidiphilum caldifontis]QSR88946.1 transaldolase [Methylacidiphilum caldifontis]TFE71810.1 transaldolase [Methylacidiphilum caldifontis]
MKMTQKLHELRQSLWLDNISKEMLDKGILKRYIEEFSITGLTSNPTIFDHAIAHSHFYDRSIVELSSQGMEAEELFFELAMDDLRRAADLFRPIHDQTSCRDGWVSLEVSPLLAYDAEKTLFEAKRLYEAFQRPNLYIKIPGTKEGLPAIEEAIFEGIPINVTLLFTPEHYKEAAEAYMRGLERRLAKGLPLDVVSSVASLFVSRWDKATMHVVPENLKNQLGIAIAKKTYKFYRDLLDSDRWNILAQKKANPQLLLWASTGTKDPQASDILYVKNLIAPDTINTMPEETLLAFADHGQIGAILPRDGADADVVLSEFCQHGVDYQALGERLQKEGAEAFVNSWKDLLNSLQQKSSLLKTV